MYPWTNDSELYHLTTCKCCHAALPLLGGCNCYLQFVCELYIFAKIASCCSHIPCYVMAWSLGGATGSCLHLETVVQGI